MAKNYAIEQSQRMEIIVQMLEAAKGRAKEQQAINSYVAWCEAEESYPEPDVSGIVSWRIECAIATDIRHLYREERPEGVFGSEYSGEYLRIKREAARKAEARKRARDAETGIEMLRTLFTL